MPPAAPTAQQAFDEELKALEASSGRKVLLLQSLANFVSRIHMVMGPPP